MGISAWQLVVVALLAVLLFGRGKISQLMGDVAKGINAFKRGMKDGDGEETEAKRSLKDDPGTIDASRGETKTGHGQG